MSNIFDLFGSVEQKATGQMKIDSFEHRETHQMPMKPIGVQQNLMNSKLQGNVPGKKQKGLSIRSKVDPNVCPPPPSANVVNKSVESFSKPKFCKNEESSKVSPPLSKKALTMLQQRQEKGIRSEIPQPVLSIPQPTQSTTFVFKKPLPPKINDRYPEPEKLSNDWTEENNFYYPRFENIKLETPPSVVPYIDEGFESDPEIPIIRNIPSPCVDVAGDFDEEFLDFEEPEVPSVDDD